MFFLDGNEGASIIWQNSFTIVLYILYSQEAQTIFFKMDNNTFGRNGKCHVWRHKNTSKSISFLEVSFFHFSSHPFSLDVFLWRHTGHFPYLPNVLLFIFPYQHTVLINLFEIIVYYIQKWLKNIKVLIWKDKNRPKRWGQDFSGLNIVCECICLVWSGKNAWKLDWPIYQESTFLHLEVPLVYVENMSCNNSGHSCHPEALS